MTIADHERPQIGQAPDLAKAIEDYERMIGLLPPFPSDQIAAAWGNVVDKVSDVVVDGGAIAAKAIQATAEHKGLVGLVATVTFSGIGSGLLSSGAGAETPGVTTAITIKAGDTESGVAFDLAKERGQLTEPILNQIEADNPTLNPYKLPIGGKLVVPAEASPVVAPAPAAAPTPTPAPAAAPTPAPAPAPETAASATAEVTITPHMTEWSEAQAISVSTGKPFEVIFNEVRADNPSLNPTDLKIGTPMVVPAETATAAAAPTSATAAAPTPTPAPAPETAASATTEVIITPGMTEWSEALHLSDSSGQPLETVFNEVRADNPSLNPTDLKIGTELVIPELDTRLDIQPLTSAAPVSSVAKVVVKPGLTYDAVAEKAAAITGTPLPTEEAQVQAANPQPATDIQPGTTINVPASTPEQAQAIASAANSIPAAPAAPAAAPTPAPVEETPEAQTPVDTPTGFQSWDINSDIMGNSGFTAAQDDLMLDGTALEGDGGYFLGEQQATGINSNYIIAAAEVESARGTSYFAQTRHNLFGIGADTDDPDLAYSYPTDEGSIQAFGQLLTSSYISPGEEYYGGGDSLHDIYVHYSTSDTPANEAAGLAEDETIASVINANLAKLQAYEMQDTAPTTTTTTTPPPTPTTTSTTVAPTTTTTTSPDTSNNESGDSNQSPSNSSADASSNPSSETGPDQTQSNSSPNSSNDQSGNSNHGRSNSSPDASSNPSTGNGSSQSPSSSNQAAAPTNSSTPNSQASNPTNDNFGNGHRGTAHTPYDQDQN